MKKQNKKGFTLAELLIVVAILAVLTAIAVPLFLGSIDKAEKAANAANVDAVRSRAIVYILENKYDDSSSKKNLWTADYTSTGWYVEATIKDDGSIEGLKIQSQKEAKMDTSDTWLDDYKNGWADSSVSGTKGTVHLILKQTDVNKN